VLQRDDLKKRQYLSSGFRSVEGWCTQDALVVISAIDSIQRSVGIAGNTAEIGVHHGRSAIVLAMVARDNEAMIAMDLFSAQHENVDRSGHGDRQRFEQNLRHWVDTSTTVAILEANSTTLDRETVLSAAKNGMSCRLFSVDGGHTKSIVMHDLALAESCITSDGVVIVDDVYNEGWPEVADALYSYLAASPTSLLPFAVAGGKVFLSASHRAYALYLEELPRRLPMFVSRQITLGRGAALSLRSATTKDRLRRSSVWQRLKPTVVGRMVRSITKHF
jgi:hypothetical protein